VRRAGQALAWLAWLASVCAWTLIALIPTVLFLGLVAAGAGVLWWAAGF
jgi:hypothetical protein